MNFFLSRQGRSLDRQITTQDIDCLRVCVNQISNIILYCSLYIRHTYNCYIASLVIITISMTMVRRTNRWRWESWKFIDEIIDHKDMKMSRWKRKSYFLKSEDENKEIIFWGSLWHVRHCISSNIFEGGFCFIHTVVWRGGERDHNRWAGEGSLVLHFSKTQKTHSTYSSDVFCVSYLCFCYQLANIFFCFSFKYWFVGGTALKSVFCSCIMQYRILTLPAHCIVFFCCLLFVR